MQIVFFCVYSLSFHNKEPILNLDCDIFYSKKGQMRKFSHILNQHMYTGFCWILPAVILRK